VEKTVLTVSVAPIFASRWLIWRIRRFNEQHPTISVRLEPNAEILNLDRAGIDIGIRVGADLSPGKHATKLLDQRVFPVCSPEFGQSVTSISDLLALPVIRENDRLYGWDTWLSGQGAKPSDLKQGPTYGDASLCLDAAMTGQGVFMAWETLACDAIEREQIIAPLQRRTATGAAYWFVTTNFSSRKKAVSTFKKWLEEELACSVRNWLNQGE
jgi:DNA-binding transcriptional LysR family regulator